MSTQPETVFAGSVLLLLAVGKNISSWKLFPTWVHARFLKAHRFLLLSLSRQPSPSNCVLHSCLKVTSCGAHAVAVAAKADLPTVTALVFWCSRRPTDALLRHHARLVALFSFLVKRVNKTVGTPPELRLIRHLNAILHSPLRLRACSRSWWSSPSKRWTIRRPCCKSSSLGAPPGLPACLLARVRACVRCRLPAYVSPYWHAVVL